MLRLAKLGPFHGGSVYFFLLSMYPTSICIMCTDIIVPRGEISLLDVL